MFSDTTSMKYWIDIQDENTETFKNTLVLKISLQDWPDVTPVLTRIIVLSQCPPVNIRAKLDGAMLVNVDYDVSEAVLTTYTLATVDYLPPDCFSSTAYRLLDSSGFEQSVAILKGTVFEINLAGYRDFSWLTNTFTLHW
jgi:hypothetical protein